MRSCASPSASRVISVTASIWSSRVGLKKSFQVRTTVIDGGLRVAVFTDRSSELRAIEAEARLQHLEALEELALGLAHEIRNPLASLRGAAVELVSGPCLPIRRSEWKPSSGENRIGSIEP